MSERPTVSIVVISHEHAADLPRCFEALTKATAGIDAELVFIDNVSDDNSFELAEELAPQPAQLLRNHRRMGFSANANQGIALSRGEAILLLNPDTAVGEGSVRALVDYLRDSDHVGVVAPKLVFPDGETQPSRRRFPTWRSALARRSPLRRWMANSGANRAHLMLDEDVAEIPETIDWALAACWLINRSALEQVGNFDEGYPLYVEDIDLCRRMHDENWRVVFLPTAVVEHHHHAVTDSKWLTWRTLAHLRGMARYARKHGLRSLS